MPGFGIINRDEISVPKAPQFGPCIMVTKEHRMKPLLAALMLFWIFAFIGAQKQVSLGKEFELKVGEKAVVDGESLTINFVEVKDDSRCPRGKTCVWAGNAEVVATVYSTADSGKKAELQLNTNLKPRTVSFGKYEIHLVGLNPYPDGDSPPDKNNYTAVFLIKKSDS